MALRLNVHVCNFVNSEFDIKKPDLHGKPIQHKQIKFEEYCTLCNKVRKPIYKNNLFVEWHYFYGD